MQPERWLKKSSFWFRTLLHRRQLDRELDDEIAYHLEARTDENIAKGMSPQKARRAARLELGGVEQVKESVRTQRAGAWLETLLQDIRFGLRILAKDWKAACLASFSLAAAMGISVAGLSVFNGIMLRPPTAASPDRLVAIYTASPENGLDGVSYPDYEYYRVHNHAFSQIAAFPYAITLRRPPMATGLGLSLLRVHP